MHTNPIQNHIWAASITKICMKKPRKNRGSSGVGRPRRVGGTGVNQHLLNTLLSKCLSAFPVHSYRDVTALNKPLIWPFLNVSPPLMLMPCLYILA